MMARMRQPHTQAAGGGPVARTCKYCSKTFSKREHLSRHERSHTKERPFRCGECGKCYSRNDTLLRHGRLHTKDKDQRTPSDHDDISTPGRVDAAAASLVDLQLIPERSQSLSELVSGNNVPDIDSMIDPNLQDFLPNDMVDHNLQQASNNHQNVSFPYSAERESWAMEVESRYPSWHIGEDFDLQVFNSTLLAPIIIDDPAWRGGSIAGQEDSGEASRLGPHGPSATSLEVKQGFWMTKVDDISRKCDGLSYPVDLTRPITPTDITDIDEVDESYQEDFSLRLGPRWREDPLPSTGFLNLALQLFFTKFNPIFPMLHAPTFRPSNNNSLLLLSICSIGSLFMGSNEATAQGSKIFERLNKVILDSWEGIFTRDSAERTALVQAAVIGQTFAYLSGNPKHLATMESFHGTVIAWARRMGMFDISEFRPPLHYASPEELDETWRSWARAEEIKRTVLGLYIHDALLATMFYHDPILWHNAIRLPAAAPDEVFESQNSAQWADLMSSVFPESLDQHLHINQVEHQPSQPLPKEIEFGFNRFSCYVILHGIGVAVHESNQAGHTSQAELKRHQDTLMCWYSAYEAQMPFGEHDPFCLVILWHEIFMSVLVNFDDLERVIGRDGSDEATRAMHYTHQWASSIEAKRCVIHASLIHRQIDSMRSDSEPAIHVPRCMFLAAIAWYCYIQFGREGSPPTPAKEIENLPEVKALNIDPFQHLFEVSSYNKGKPTVIEASPLCGLTDMLHRLGHWDIARKFARILDLLIHGDTDSLLADGL